jgi:hypothetical protein
MLIALYWVGMLSNIEQRLEKLPVRKKFRGTEFLSIGIESISF